MFQSKIYRLGSSQFADSDEDAKDRYLAHKSVDPFPEIPSALLNTADFSDYVATTGLIFPFEEDDENLKLASYNVRLLGEIVYWTQDREEKSFVIGEGDELRLPANSIAYIMPEPIFRIPDYIKVWFHLDASHVHKGLYLNAGFIDPGFVGRLCLPLHNPTAKEYLLRACDPLIWITLMKISQVAQWEQPVLFKSVRGKFREFPQRKLKPLQRIDDYREKALARRARDNEKKSYSFVGIAHSGHGSLSTKNESTLEEADRREGWSLP